MSVCAGPLFAQERQRASAAAPFHREPRGIQLGTLASGATYATGEARGGWTELTLEGWIWARSVESTTRDGFDLVVTAGGGEVVRAEPNGPIVGRFVEGTLLDRLGNRGGWFRVRRTGWAASSALAGRAAPAPPPPAPVAAEPRAPEQPASRSDSLPPQRPSDSVRGAPPAAGPPAPEGAAHVTLRQGAELATGPDGARVAVLERSDRAVLVERSGEWARVRIEGWVRATEIGAVVDAGPRITGAMLQQTPDRYVGQPVTWRIQYLAQQTADELRPEMPLGTSYLLARGPLPETGFVYVMLSRTQAAELSSLEPLDEIRIEAVIRAARTRYLPTPVVELTKLLER